MTKFKAFYNLCPVHDAKQFLGISPDYEAGNIIATLGGNIAIVIKISSQKQIRSWSVLEKYSCKVVFDRKSQQYVGVFANIFMRLWDESTTDVNKCKKLKFHRNIVDLVHNEDETLVVYADGKCESLSSAIESRKENSGENLVQEMLSVNSIIDPKIINLAGGQKAFTYFQKNKDRVLELVKTKLDLVNLKPTGTAERFNLRRSGQDVAVTGYSVIETESSPALLTIWADGRVFLMKLNSSVTSQNSPGQFVSMFTDLKVDTPLTILGLSKNCVAIYGANNTQEGGSLLLYNTQFKVVKAKQFFKIHFSNSRLWTVGSSILLATGQNLAVVSYQTSKELLAELVGSQVSNNFSQTVESEFLNEEEELEDQLSLAEIQKSPPAQIGETPRKNEKKQKKGAEQQATENVADGKTIPFMSDDDFNRDLNSLMNRDVYVELLEVESPLAELEVNLMSNYYDPGFISEEVELITKQLEQCGATEHEITEKLLWVLIKADLVENIAACLRRYSSISERILVKTLKYVLEDFQLPPPKKRKSTNKFEHMEIDVDNGDTNEFPNVDLLDSKELPTIAVKKRKDLMNIILSCSFDTAAISPYIRKEINYEQVLIMLEYLQILIDGDEPCLEERPECSDKFDEDLRILQWFGVFLNTHFQKMSLSRDIHLMEILLKWHRVFVNYKSQISELQNVSALLYNIVHKKQISKERNYSKWYSIEEVQLY